MHHPWNSAWDPVGAAGEELKQNLEQREFLIWGFGDISICAVKLSNGTRRVSLPTPRHGIIVDMKMIIQPQIWSDQDGVPYR